MITAYAFLSRTQISSQCVIVKSESHERQQAVEDRMDFPSCDSVVFLTHMRFVLPESEEVSDGRQVDFMVQGRREITSNANIHPRSIVIRPELQHLICPLLEIIGPVDAREVLRVINLVAATMAKPLLKAFLLPRYVSYILFQAPSNFTSSPGRTRNVLMASRDCSYSGRMGISCCDIGTKM